MVKNLRVIAGLLLGLTMVFLASRAAANEVAQWNETTMNSDRRQWSEQPRLDAHAGHGAGLPCTTP